jgi:hypothetical protein
MRPRVSVRWLREASHDDVEHYVKTGEQRISVPPKTLGGRRYRAVQSFLTKEAASVFEGSLIARGFWTASTPADKKPPYVVYARNIKKRSPKGVIAALRGSLNL